MFDAVRLLFGWDRVAIGVELDLPVSVQFVGPLDGAVRARRNQPVVARAITGSTRLELHLDAIFQGDPVVIACTFCDGNSVIKLRQGDLFGGLLIPTADSRVERKVSPADRLSLG